MSLTMTQMRKMMRKMIGRETIAKESCEERYEKM